MKERTLRKNSQQIINITATVVIIAIWAVLLSFPFRLSILRLATSLKDIGAETGNQFIRFINKDKMLPDYVDKLPDYKKYLEKTNKKQQNINKEGTEANEKTIEKNNKKYWNNFKNKDNFKEYAFDYLLGLMYFVQAITIFLILWILIKIILKEHFKRIKNAPTVKTKSLKRYLIIEKKIIERVKQSLLGYRDFIQKNNWVKYSYIFLFLITSNFLTIIIEFFAYYFKFFRTMSFGSITFQLYKLGYDLKIYFKTVPVTFHIIFGIYVFNLIRRQIGLRRLVVYENRNSGLVENLPICSMLVGTMGTKKTTILTDMSLTMTNNFKNRALDELLQIRKQFPKFNYSKLDDFLKRCILFHQIYSLKSIDKIWDKKVMRALRKDEPSMFGEKVLSLGEFDSALSQTDILSSFRTYSKLFLVYYLNSALLYSNYAIRFDFQFASVGNFPLYQTDFFTQGSYVPRDDEMSTFSHILDFDMLRLGKKLIEDSEASKVYDFGFFALTEIGKERGNQLTTQGKKRTDEEPNQKNDYFNSFIKLIRHTSTINNYPYCKFLADEQRPESLEADLRELFDIVRIKRSDKYKCTFPLYFERLFIEFMNEVYDKYNLERIFYRSNDSLKYYLARKFIGWLYGINTRILNKYGVYKCDLVIETSGSGDIKEAKYYLMKKKIYSNRFKTDAYNAFFADSRSDYIGIGDVSQYESTRASKSELMAQNSYFINDLNKYNQKEEKEDERAK